jgi:hypothetical protein
VLALGAGVCAVAVVLVMLFTSGPSTSSVSSAQAGSPRPVSAFEAELRLELRYGGRGDNEVAAVSCPYRIEPGQLVRCELRYEDGIARAVLVHLTASGRLEADIPYPATLRR